MPAFRARNDSRVAAFHDGNDAIGRAQINADDFSHVCNFSSVEIKLQAKSAKRKGKWAVAFNFSLLTWLVILPLPL